ncbi:MAG: response regulator [Planctomycetes bacterium]|nr:response regulator [Planctomycetota bacterium]
MAAKPRQILLIDDNPTAGELVSALLHRNGYVARVATDAESALSLLRAGGIDAIVSESTVGGAEAFTLCRGIRSTPELAHVPIVFLASGGGMEDEFQGYLSGGDAWLTKPFRARDLLDALDRVLWGNSRPSSSARLAALKDTGRAIAAVTGPRAALLRSACRQALCELEIEPTLATALSRADREKFDLLLCESDPLQDVQRQVSNFLDQFGLNLPVVFLLEHTQPLTGAGRWAVQLPATPDQIAAVITDALRSRRPA